MPSSDAPAAPLLRELRDEVRSLYPRGRVFIGIDGRDGAGKTVFADGLAEAFVEAGATVLRASLDDFHCPRAERYALGRTSPQGHYRDSYDYEAFRRLLIEPFRAGAGFRLRGFDLALDAPVETPEAVAPPDAYLIVDGLFVHRPELRGLWHWSVWLDVPAEVAFARMADRDGTDPDPAAESNRRYRDGYELYMRDGDPRGAASVLVDNSDPRAPWRVFADSC